MVTQVLLWSAVIPGVTALVLLLPWLLRRRSRMDGPAPRRGWAGALAVGLGLFAGGVGQVGLGSGPNHRVLYVALGATLVGLLVDESRWRGVLLWLVRGLAGVAVGLVLILPLARSLQWSNTELAWRVAAVAAAALVSWAVLGRLTRRERGPAAALSTLAWTLAVAAGLVLSASASSGLLAGGLAATLGAACVVLLLAPPAEGRLNAAVPVVSLTVAALLAAGKLYASMPWSSFALLAAAPLGLLAMPWRERRPGLAVWLRTAALLLVAGAGVGLAARHYFAPHAPATAEEGGSYAPYGNQAGYAPYGPADNSDDAPDDEGYGGYGKYRTDRGVAPADAGPD